MNKTGIIGVPSSAGARYTGQEKAPKAFRNAGLIELLREAGQTVIDFGDLPEVAYIPDHLNPKAQNLERVAEVARSVTKKTQEALSDEAVPIILGGDCTIAIGVISGFLSHVSNPGLLYFDGDLDLNTPDTTVSGILDGMVLAHIIGKGAELLSRIGPRYPLMPQENIVLFGYNAETGGIDEVEIQILDRCRMAKYPLSQIRDNVKEAASEALAQLEEKTDSILIHFDVDVIDFGDFPAGDLPHYHGLGFDEAMGALKVFLSSSKLGGLVITEFNAQRDTEDRLARRFVESLVKAIGKRGD